MLGLMQDFPLMVPRILTYAEKFHRHTEIVPRRLEGEIHRYTLADLGRRARQLASVMEKLGVESRQVVGTIAWNGYRHMELYYALPGNMMVTGNPDFYQEAVRSIPLKRHAVPPGNGWCGPHAGIRCR